MDLHKRQFSVYGRVGLRLLQQCGVFTKVVSPQMCPWHSQAFRLFYAGHRKSAIELVRIVAPSSEFL